MAYKTNLESLKLNKRNPFNSVYLTLTLRGTKELAPQKYAFWVYKVDQGE